MSPKHFGHLIGDVGLMLPDLPARRAQEQPESPDLVAADVVTLSLDERDPAALTQPRCTPARVGEDGRPARARSEVWPRSPAGTRSYCRDRQPSDDIFRRWRRSPYEPCDPGGMT